jgi:hypothetical protein
MQKPSNAASAGQGASSPDVETRLLTMLTS